MRLLTFHSSEEQSLSTPSQTSSYENTFNKFAIENTQTLDYGDANLQILMLGADNDKLHKRGFRDEGMLIPVLEDDFLNVKMRACLQLLITNNRILQIYDFVSNAQPVYTQCRHNNNTRIDDLTQKDLQNREVVVYLFTLQ